MLSDDQRRRLAVKGKALGRRQLEQFGTLFTSDTILRWHRQLIANKWDYSDRKEKKVGRPRIRQVIVDLTVRFAKENPTWGYDRIQGELANVGYRISDTTVGNILKAHGIETAPKRKRTGSWETFLKAHWDVLAAIDFTTIEVWTKNGLMTFYVLFVTELKTRRVHFAGCTRNPHQDWMKQVARELTNCDGDGRDDLIFRNVEHGNNRIVFSRGHGQFTEVTNRISSGYIDGFDEMSIGDFDGDGRDDLIFREVENGANRVLFARDTERFMAATDRIPWGWINGAEEMITGDPNGDGHDHLIFPNLNSGSNRVIYGYGNEQFAEVTNQISEDWINNFDEVLPGDFDGNGRVDLFFREVESGVNRLIYSIPPTTTVPNSSDTDSDDRELPPWDTLPPMPA